jgi:hypothetical protein
MQMRTIALALLAAATLTAMASSAEARHRVWGPRMASPAAIAGYAAISHYEYYEGPLAVYYYGPYAWDDPTFSPRFWRRR